MMILLNNYDVDILAKSIEQLWSQYSYVTMLSFALHKWKMNKKNLPTQSIQIL